MICKESFYNVILREDESNHKILLANTDTLAVAWLDMNEYEKIQNRNDIILHDSLSKMLSMHFIVPKDYDEQGKIFKNHIELINNETPSKLIYIIAPTLECNMHCKYCFEGITPQKRCMSNEDIKKVVEFIKKQISINPTCNEIHISWFGGEPTLQIDKILFAARELSSFCREKDIKYISNIVTNGLLFTKDVALRLVKDAKISRAQITIDGLADTYSNMKGTHKKNFYKVIQNIKECSEILKINIRVNSYPKNENELIELFRYILKENDLNGRVGMYITPIYNCEANQLTDLYGEREFIEFSKRFDDILNKEGIKYNIYGSLPRRFDLFCGLSKKNNYCIGPDLNLYRCEHFIGRKEYSVGNVITGLNEQNSFDAIFFDYEIETKCKDCKYYPICQGGCRSLRMTNNVTINCDYISEKFKYQMINFIKYIRLKNKTILK